jgi:hypothetical protein
VAKLSQIVRNLADIVVEIDGTDDDGNPIKVPVTVTYRPRLMTLAFRDQFGRHLAVLNKAQRDAEAAAERGEDATAVLNDPNVDRAAGQISEMTLNILDSWDVEDEDANGKPVPLPLPKTAEEMQAFVAPEMMRAVMEAVMAALNPNRKAGEQSAKDSPAT